MTRHWRRSGVFIVNIEQISYLFLLFQLLTLNKHTFPAFGVFLDLRDENVMPGLDII